MLQWCSSERVLDTHTTQSPGGDKAHATSEQESYEAGWQLVARVPARPSSPAGMRSAVLSLAWHNSAAAGDVWLAFALADGVLGVLDLAPNALQPELLWAYEAHADPIGAHRRLS